MRKDVIKTFGNMVVLALLLGQMGEAAPVSIGRVIQQKSPIQKKMVKTEKSAKINENIARSKKLEQNFTKKVEILKSHDILQDLLKRFGNPNALSVPLLVSGGLSMGYALGPSTSKPVIWAMPPKENVLQAQSDTDLENQKPLNEIFPQNIADQSGTSLENQKPLNEIFPQNITDQSGTSLENQKPLNEIFPQNITDQTGEDHTPQSAPSWGQWLSNKGAGIPYYATTGATISLLSLVGGLATWKILSRKAHHSAWMSRGWVSASLVGNLAMTYAAPYFLGWDSPSWFLSGLSAVIPVALAYLANRVNKKEEPGAVNEAPADFNEGSVVEGSVVIQPFAFTDKTVTVVEQSVSAKEKHDDANEEFVKSIEKSVFSNEEHGAVAEQFIDSKEIPVYVKEEPADVIPADVEKIPADLAELARRKNEQEDWELFTVHVDSRCVLGIRINPKFKIGRFAYDNNEVIIQDFWFNDLMRKHGKIPNSELASKIRSSYDVIRKGLPRIIGQAESFLPETIEEALESGKLDGVKSEIYAGFFSTIIKELRIDELAEFLDKDGNIVFSTDMLSKLIWNRMLWTKAVWYEDGKEWRKFSELLDSQRLDIKKILEDCGVERLTEALKDRVSEVQKMFLCSRRSVKGRPSFVELLSVKDFSKFWEYCEKGWKQEETFCDSNGSYFHNYTHKKIYRNTKDFNLNLKLSPACKAILGEDVIKKACEDTTFFAKFKQTIRDGIIEKHRMIWFRLQTEIEHLPVSTVVLFLKQNGEIQDSEVLSKRIWETIISSWKNGCTKIISKSNILADLTNLNRERNAYHVDSFQKNLIARRDGLQRELLEELPSKIKKLKSSSIEVDTLLKAGNDPVEMSNLILGILKKYSPKLLKIVSLEALKTHLENPANLAILNAAIQKRHQVFIEEQNKELRKQYPDIEEVLIEEVCIENKKENEEFCRDEDMSFLDEEEKRNAPNSNKKSSIKESFDRDILFK